MGVLDAVGDAANTAVDTTMNDFESVTSFALTPIQEPVKGAANAAGMSDDGFARESAEVADTVKGGIVAPGRWVGEKTEGTPIDNPATDAAVKGGEAIYNLFGEWTAGHAYGAATGVDLKGEDPQQAAAPEGGYGMGALETAELAMLGWGPAAKGVSKVGTTGARALRGSRTMKAARAADDSVSTAVKTTVKNTPSRVSRTVKKPSHLAETGFRSVKDAAMYAYPSSRLGKAAYGGVGLMGASGLADMSFGFPQNYEKFDKLSQYPGATLVKEVDNDGKPFGYWVVLESEGDTHTVLTSTQSTRQVEFPSEAEPSFDSSEQARTAFERYASAIQDGRRDLPAVLQDQERADDERTWHKTQVKAMLDAGWYLFEQTHREKEKKRYAVAGKQSDGTLIYIQPGGEAGVTPESYPDKATAMEHYSQWKRTRSGPSPDPSEERPQPNEIVESLSTTTGALGSIGLTAAGIGIGALIVLALVIL